MSTLTVGSNQQYKTISSAVAASHAGDTIDVQAGTYTNDFLTIGHSLTLQAVGGQVNMVATQAPPNGKAIIDEGGSGVAVSITGFALSGAAVDDGNGAGIRYEGGKLTLDRVYVHDNQDGLLAASDRSGSIAITNSEFANNGAGDGYTHNIYVNQVGSLTIGNSYIHDANVGHEVKSRALSTTIENSRIIDGTGTASYSIDLPNGGNAVIRNNVIQQGPNTQNPIMISYGEEGSLNGGSQLTIAGNQILNDLSSGSATGIANYTKTGATVSGNQVYGLSAVQLAHGPATVTGTSVLTSQPVLNLSSPWLATSSAAPAAGTTTAPSPLASGTAYSSAGLLSSPGYISPSATVAPTTTMIQALQLPQKSATLLPLSPGA